MGRVRRKIIFCTECGKQNPERKRVCNYCKKELHQKNHLLKDYLYDNIKDNLKDKAVDNIYSLLKNYFLSHLYGSVLIATVIFTTASIILNTVTNNEKIKVVKTRPIVSSNLSICKNSIPATLRCDDSLGFNENDMCVKVRTVNAKSSKGCSDGYYLSNNKCISNKTYTKVTEKKCLKPSTLPSFLSTWDDYLGVEEYNGECLLQYCLSDGWDENGICQSGSADTIPYTTITKCDEGSLINGECKKTKSTTTQYTCEEGTLSEKKCNIEYEEEPIILCDEGYEYNKECKACVEVE